MSHIRRLGLGLGALLGGESESSINNEHIESVEVSRVRPNPFQPRADFNEEEIASLAESLKRQGVLQPVVVRPAEGGLYELVAGERRWRASQKAGLDRIPAVVREVDDRRMLEMALVENLQRRDLNPIEKARAFRRLIELNSWTQEEVADAVGLGRPTVTNFIRLLELPPEVQEAVSRGTITMGHARALLGVTPRSAQLRLLRRIIEEDLSVRALEKLARRPSETESANGGSAPSRREPYLEELERKLMDRLGVRVEIMPEAIVIPYGSNQQLTAILKRLGVL